ncbi:hypothetical protein [Thalassotalea sp. ND16A]|uniref:hypothetical protein n=1 Tax=Thalassotalea sp. ND16A TaxID=1535422 RepID=UPI00051D2A59|nr:hypothetical protein [Thalassotalea sp. ND16A]KGJ90225.1 hypothetical protein ND16A_1955 [Thalassotalea sp. ND16A]
MLMRLFFLLPVIMCLVWWWYLTKHGYSAKQGLKGFAYILAFNLIIAGFFTLMIHITQ